jgi:hypothetical protein
VVCLIGNANYELLDPGTDKDVIAFIPYALRNGMAGYDHIFSASNCIYTGMRLYRFQLMLYIWREDVGRNPGRHD